MCLIFLSFNQHPEFPFIAIANRDEFYDRPARQIHRWSDHEEVIAGQDLNGGGTWLGINTSGYFAMLTNYRDMANINSSAPTRGKLVSDFLINKLAPASYLQALNASAKNYNGYNILLGSFNDPWYYSNQDNRIYRLGTGSYGLSNALLDSDWPKLTEGKALFEKLIKEQEIEQEDLFSMMLDKKLAADEHLPDTGIGYEKEKQLSARFIQMGGYGTRNTTLVMVNKEGTGSIKERVFNQDGEQVDDKTIEFTINK